MTTKWHRLHSPACCSVLWGSLKPIVQRSLMLPLACTHGHACMRARRPAAAPPKPRTCNLLCRGLLAPVCCCQCALVCVGLEAHRLDGLIVQVEAERDARVERTLQQAAHTTWRHGTHSHPSTRMCAPCCRLDCRQARLWAPMLPVRCLFSLTNTPLLSGARQSLL